MAKTLKTSAENRKCQYPACENILSIYNHQLYCHVHLNNLPIDVRCRTANVNFKK